MELLGTTLEFIHFLLRLNSFEQFDGTLDVLAELLLIEPEVAHRPLDVLRCQLLERLLHLFNRSAELFGIDLLQQFLQFEILLQRLWRDRLMFIEQLCHLLKLTLRFL